MSERQRPDLEQIAKQVKIQNENRMVWELHDTPENLEEMFWQEVKEMRECEDQFFLKPYSDFHMISEVGDVGYLFIRYQQSYGEAPREMAKALGEAINISTRCGFRMTDAVELKLWRNSHKYGDTHFDVFGSFEDGVKISKSLWESMGSDHAFFRWYSEYYGQK